jgi:hypothetical protein
MFDAVLLGAVGTYIYELHDERWDPRNTNRENHFGLFNSAGSPKAAAKAIHNLTTILGDAVVSSATYPVCGLPSTGNTLCLSGHGGAFLAIWAEPTIRRQSTRTETAAPTANVAVNLGTSYSQVQDFDPMKDVSFAEINTNISNLLVGVDDHPLIIQME